MSVKSCKNSKVGWAGIDNIYKMEGGAVFHAAALCRKCPAVQLYGVKRFRTEAMNRFFSPDHHGKGRSLHPANIQCRSIKDGEETGGIHPDQPVGLGTAECFAVITGIGGTIREMRESLPDRGFLHAGEPEPSDGLIAFAVIVNQLTR